MLAKRTTLAMHHSHDSLSTPSYPPLEWSKHHGGNGSCGCRQPPATKPNSKVESESVFFLEKWCFKADYLMFFDCEWPKKWACFNSWPSVKAALMFRVVGSGLNISDRANIRMPVTIPRFQIELRHRMHWGLRASTNYGQSDPQCNDGVFDVISLQAARSRSSPTVCGKETVIIIPFKKALRWP